jgi:beta-lactamase regulating signal transducer with metallopeptidase domain
MERLIDWLSVDVLHALGWALIHSLWECLGVAALAAILMGFSRRPAIRYLVAIGALAAMLVLPTATFLLAMKPAASVPLFRPAGGVSFALSTLPNPPAAAPVAPGAGATAMNKSAAIVAADIQVAFPAGFLAADFLPPNILPALVMAWLCGVTFFSLRFAGGFLLLEQRRRRQSQIPDSRILAICLKMQDQLGLTRAIRYLACNWISSPGVIGWLRPVVLLPVAVLTGLSEAQLRAVIAHELAHIRRHDFFVNFLQVLVETLLFYHPAVWWLNRRIRVERELCCDEIAVALTGDRLEYAKVLTLMADWEKAPALAMAANRSPLSERIFHILGKRPLSTGRRTLGLAGSVLFLVAALIAARALLGIAHPIAVPSAEARGKAPSPPKRIAAKSLEPRVLSSVIPAAKPAVADSSGGGQRSPEKPASHQTEAAAGRPVGRLVVPSLDLSRLLLAAPATPHLGASDPTLAPAPPAPVASPVVAARMARSNVPTCAVPVITLSVPLKRIPGSDLRTVPVAINAASKQFLLDIGTRPTEISQAAATDLQLPDASRLSSSSQGLAKDLEYASVAIFDVKGAGSADNYRPHVRAASFTIGGAAGHDLTLAVASDREMGRSKPYDGVMTGGPFGQSDIELDFVQNRLNYLKLATCTDPDQVAYWPHASAATIPMTKLNGKIQIQVSILGRSIPAVIDTASPRTVMRRDIAELLFGFEADTPDMMPDGNLKDGAGLQIYQHTFPVISLSGGVTAYNVPALIQASSMVRNLDRSPILGSRAQFSTDPRQRIPALTLGMDVLSQLHLYAAFDQLTLYVTVAEPAAGAAPGSPLPASLL